MAKVLYTAVARVTGGRIEGHGETSDGALVVDIRIPKELGGDGGGTNPEQLFAVGFAACFESAIGAVARRRKLEAGDVAIESRVMLSPTEERGFSISAELDVSLPSIEDAEEAQDLIRAAHQVCPYSVATRGNMDVAFTVNGVELAAA